MQKVARLAVLIPTVGVLLGLSSLSLSWSFKGSDGPRALVGVLVHPAREMRLAMARLKSGESIGDAATVASVNRALQFAPLEEEPFIVAGLRRYEIGDFKAARRLVEAARRRNPRSREALYLSADVALAEGDIRGAVESLEVLMRVAPRQSQLPREALFLLANTPETSRPAFAALSGDGIKSDALAALARSGAAPERLLEAIKLTRAAQIIAGNPSQINAIVRPLVDANDLAGAYRVWSALLLTKPSKNSGIRPDDFASTLPPPFGWEIGSTTDGYAEAGAEGLRGEIYGRRATQLARRITLLRPGSYQLQVRAYVPNESVEAIVICLPNTELARAAIVQKNVMSSSFNVPTGCAGLSLEVRARASDPPQPSAFHIRSLRIVEAGA